MNAKKTIEESTKKMYSEEQVLNLLSKFELPKTEKDLYKIKKWFDKINNN